MSDPILPAHGSARKRAGRLAIAIAGGALALGLFAQPGPITAAPAGTPGQVMAQAATPTPRPGCSPYGRHTHRRPVCQTRPNRNGKGA